MVPLPQQLFGGLYDKVVKFQEKTFQEKKTISLLICLVGHATFWIGKVVQGVQCIHVSRFLYQLFKQWLMDSALNQTFTGYNFALQ